MNETTLPHKIKCNRRCEENIRVRKAASFLENKTISGDVFHFVTVYRQAMLQVNVGKNKIQFLYIYTYI